MFFFNCFLKKADLMKVSNASQYENTSTRFEMRAKQYMVDIW